MLKIKKYWDLMHWKTLLFHHEGTDAHITRQENNHYVLHNAAVTAVKDV